jgi:DNA-binding response OmpR family regulator
MEILIAEDDCASRRVLQTYLERWNYRLKVAQNGEEAWQALQGPHPPMLLITDWMMPKLDGLEFCRRVRGSEALRRAYIILLSSRTEKENIVLGLEAGADDYVLKPFDARELRARVQVGVRVLQLQQELAERVKRLEEAIAQVTQLRGLLPICSYCKKVRDDKNYWHQVEAYMTCHSDLRFSHGICPECFERCKAELEAEKPTTA